MGTVGPTFAARGRIKGTVGPCSSAENLVLLTVKTGTETLQRSGKAVYAEVRWRLITCAHMPRQYVCFQMFRRNSDKKESPLVDKKKKKKKKTPPLKKKKKKKKKKS